MQQKLDNMTPPADGKTCVYDTSGLEELPFHYHVEIEEHMDGTLSVTITETGAGGNVLKSVCYPHISRHHHAYLDLFAALSRDFGFRSPLNRLSQPLPAATTTYATLLTKNIHPGMLYGYGDPAVLRVDNASDGTWYYLAVTSNDAPDSFPLCRSRNLKDWSFAGFIFPAAHKPAWAADGEGSDYWAPEIHYIGNEYRVYFVARKKETLELCIGVARALHPAGPYIADPAPLLTGDKIDPHVFVESTGAAYLYWKEDNNALWPARLIALLRQHPAFVQQLFTTGEDRKTASLMVVLQPWLSRLLPMETFLAEQVFIESVTLHYHYFREQLSGILTTQTPAIREAIAHVLEVMKTPVYAQQLTADGAGLQGEPVKVMENDQHWEAHLVEGIWVTKQQAHYYLFYSANDFSTAHYGIGVAVAGHPLGPYTKLPGQLLRSTAQWVGPGHPSMATGADGKPHLFFHAFFPGEAGYKAFRALLSTVVTFSSMQVQLEPAQ